MFMLIVVLSWHDWGHRLELITDVRGLTMSPTDNDTFVYLHCLPSVNLPLQ